MPFIVVRMDAALYGSLRCYTVDELTSGHGSFHCDGLRPGFDGCMPVINGWAQCPAVVVWMRRVARNEAGSPLGGED